MTIVDADRSDIWFEFKSENERNTCAHSGDCYNDCADMVDSNLAEFEKIPRENVIKALIATGGWDREELVNMDSRELYIKIIWIAAGEAMDRNELEGYISTY